MTNIDKFNQLLGKRLGLSPADTPMYKWVRADELLHFRYVGDKWIEASKVTHLLAPEPQFERVSAYPHLKRRWIFAKWKGFDQDEWDRAFGSRVPFSKRGMYLPFLVMREGKIPTQDITETFIDQVLFERSRTVKEAEEVYERAQERSDRAVWNRIYDIIDDATTAFGNDPGKRSGSVSFPAVG